MAGIQWTGGAHAGAKAAKGNLRHNDKEERLVAEHSNDNIDKTLTPGNWAVVGGSYEEKCRRYDERLAQVMEGVRVSSGKNQNNTLQVCIVYEPQTLDGKRLDREQLHVFYGNVYAIACELFGEENVIELDVHVDELHNYYDPKTMTEAESRIHGHLAMVPAVPFKVVTQRVPVLDEDGNPIPLREKVIDPDTGKQKVDPETGEKVWGDELRYAKDDPLGDDEHGYRWRKGDVKVKTKKVVTREPLPEGEYRLNWNAFATPKNIIAFNQAVHKMCQREFGIDYMTGEGKHAGRSVEQMKRDSRIAEANQQVERAAEDAAKSREAADKWGDVARDHAALATALLNEESVEVGGETVMGVQGALRVRDDVLDEADRIAEDAAAEMAAAEQAVMEAAFEAEVIVHEAEVESKRVNAEAAKALDERERAVAGRESAVADREHDLEAGRREVDQGKAFVAERTRSLDAYAEQLADVGNDGFYDFVDRAISDEGNMEAMFSLKAGDGRSTEDDMADREPNPSFRQRLKRTVMNLAGRLISAMMLKWSRDREQALGNAIREHEEAVEAGKRRFLDEYQGDGVDGGHDGRGREFE